MALSRTVKAVSSLFVGGVVAVLLAVAGATPVSAHGYTTSPTSRQLHCAQRTVADCGPIQYEPQSVEGPKGFPQAGPADGQICAGGNGGFAPLDNPRGGNWPKTNVTAGAQFQFGWKFTAPHSTSKFEYFITKDGWNPLDPIGRSDLELTPFLTVPFSGQPPYTYTHGGTLPSGKSGHHVILAVWSVADTGNAFYACSDVNFGGDPGNPGEPGEPGQCDTPAWSPSGTYTGGTVVSHNGSEYRAKWWTQGEEPGTTGDWGVWESLGAC
ncbi:chitin-binding protein [Stackebrandtia albiflava]|uniref:Chitin-binding protein n=1 Tax=Stackebrandtia albiflava TaxID=406432 RepID=A0A562VDU0_9ACTN|nr:lytic polysaccharide monooxygenase [Stackebrandtia albiflava]TWJ15981.1 chitin-binding protein [Stackebrandtia albiflava]